MVCIQFYCFKEEMCNKNDYVRIILRKSKGTQKQICWKIVSLFLC